MGERPGRLGIGRDRKRCKPNPTFTPKNIKLSIFIKDEANEI